MHRASDGHVLAEQPRATMPFISGKWHAKMPIMVGKLTLDKAGRVVLPKSMRDELHLEPGDALEIESTGEEITLRPLRGQAQLRKKQGVWVFRTGETLSASETERVVHQVRHERESEILDQDP